LSEPQPEPLSKSRSFVPHIVLTFVGDLDASTVPALTAQIDDAFKVVAERLTLDLSQVTFIDSTAHGALLRARNLCHAYGIALTLRAPSYRVRRLLDLTGTLALFTIEDATPTIGQLA
jgi:anti-sigma B factor antagonist